MARAQGDRVRGDVLAGAAQVLAAPRLGRDADARRALRAVAFQHQDLLDRNHGVETVRHARAGHDLAGFATRDARGVAGGLFALDREFAAGGDRVSIGAQCETVHRRVVERRQRHRRDHVFGEHAPRASASAMRSAGNTFDAARMRAMASPMPITPVPGSVMRFLFRAHAVGMAPQALLPPS